MLCIDEAAAAAEAKPDEACDSTGRISVDEFVSAVPLENE